jgi:hypothetical protein
VGLSRMRKGGRSERGFNTHEAAGGVGDAGRSVAYIGWGILIDTSKERAGPGAGHLYISPPSPSLMNHGPLSPTLLRPPPCASVR